MNGRPVPVGREVLPGQTVDLTANLTAPSAYGVFQGFWQMRNNLGNFFGEGRAGVGHLRRPTPTRPQPHLYRQRPTRTHRNARPRRLDGQPQSARRQPMDQPRPVHQHPLGGGWRQCSLLCGWGQCLWKGGHDQTVCPPFTQTYELRVVTLQNERNPSSLPSTLPAHRSHPPSALTSGPIAPTVVATYNPALGSRVCRPSLTRIKGWPASIHGRNAPAIAPSACVVCRDGVEERRDIFVRVIQNNGGGGEWKPDE